MITDVQANLISSIIDECFEVVATQDAYDLYLDGLQEMYVETSKRFADASVLFANDLRSHPRP